MSDVTGGSRWPELIETVLGIEAAQDSGSAVRLLEATLAFVGCVGAQLVEWVHQRPSPVCGAGRSLRLASRPAEGLAAFAGHPLAVGRVDEYRDLVLIREPWDEPFGPEAAEHARALATLLRHTPSVGRKDAVEALHRLSTEIVRTLDVDRVLLAISNAAARLSSSEIAGVFLVHDGPEGPELRMQSVVGHRTMETARLRVRKGRGIAGKVLDTGRPQRVDQYATTTEITKDYFAIAMQEGTQSGLSIPMCDTDGTIIGVLSTWRRRASVYSEEDEDLLVSLAGLATIGIVNARRYHQQQQATAAVEGARAQLQQRLRASDEALAIHRTLTEIAAEGLDLLALAEALHEFLGGPVVIAPSNDRAPVQYPPARPGEPTLAPDPWQHEYDNGHERDQHAAGPRWVGAPVEAAGVRRGVIHVLLPRRPAPRDIVTLEQAATICAVLLMHETLLDATVGRLRSEFVWDLLEGRRSPSGDDAGRACSLGLRLHYPARVVLVAADGLDTLARAMRLSAEQHHHHRALLTSRIGKALSSLAGQDVPLASRDERVAVIVPASAVPDADALVQALRECSPFATVSLRAGVSSRKAEPDLLAEGLREARVALTAAAGSARGAVLFDDLGVLQFLLGSGGALELDDYARRVLGPLVDYDARHDAQLVATLDAYLANGCNASRTARAIRLHLKSVQYRLRRISEIGGLDLNDRETRLDAELALRIIGPARTLRSAVNARG